MSRVEYATQRPVVDFGDLLVALADDLDEIRQCVGCGADSTWAGLFLSEDGTVNATAWCDEPACVHDREVLSAGQVLACPIDHLPSLRKPPTVTVATVEAMARQLELDRAVPYWQGDRHGETLDHVDVWLSSLRDHLANQEPTS